MKYKTIFGKEAILNNERWRHIAQTHPEVVKYRDRIKDVLAFPEIVKISKHNANVHLYYKFYKDIFGGKFLLVVLNSKRKTIVTAFITNSIKTGGILWQKK